LPSPDPAADGRGPAAAVLSADRVDRVQETWTRVGVRVEVTALAERFYARLFAIDPSLRELFGDDLDAQAVKFVRMLDLIVVSLGRPQDVVGLVDPLGRSHARYGVDRDGYRAGRTSLLGALDDVLGDEFAPADRDAWAAAYDHLQERMISAGARDDPAR
jgi:hemoglobin-like flavoprotein